MFPPSVEIRVEELKQTLTELSNAKAGHKHAGSTMFMSCQLGTSYSGALLPAADLWLLPAQLMDSVQQESPVMNCCTVSLFSCRSKNVFLLSGCV